MKLLKWFATLLLIVLVIGSVATFYLANNLDDIVLNIIEQSGSEATQTKVSVDAVEIDLLAGTGLISGLSIANPPGFDSPFAFRVDRVILGLDITSLAEPVIVITQVTVSGATLVAEQKGTTTNLSQLNKNLQTRESEASSKQPPDDARAADTRLMVEQFSLTQTQGSITTQQWGERTLTLPDVNRNNIGDKITGLTPQQLSGELLGAVIGQVEKSTQDYLAKLAQDELSKRLKQELKTKLKVDDEVVDGALKSLFDKVK